MAVGDTFTEPQIVFTKSRSRFEIIVSCLAVVGWCWALVLAVADELPNPSSDPDQWSEIVADDGNRWMIRDASVFAILSIEDEDDAELLERKTLIHLPGISIGSKLSQEEIHKQILEREAQK